MQGHQGEAVEGRRHAQVGGSGAAVAGKQQMRTERGRRSAGCNVLATYRSLARRAAGWLHVDAIAACRQRGGGGGISAWRPSFRLAPGELI